jgi:putative nucleotidyltransferase with HDIG domain
MIRISDDRLKHCLSVARKLEQLAKVIGWDEEKCKEMFTLGLLHDIGYEYSEKQEEHSIIGGDILKNLGYKYWREVFYHGLVTFEYDSEELKLLNIADFSVNSKGIEVSIEKRLQDIEENYGETSDQYIDACKLAISMCLI